MPKGFRISSSLTLICFIVLASLVCSVLSQDQLPLIRTLSTLVVNLTDYGAFESTQVNQTLTGRLLPFTVDAWLGIDYAIQPTGDRRFRPIEGRPPPFEGVKDASAYGKVCVQDPNITDYEQDEACLNFNVYRTAGVSLDEKLPTLVWIHGGGFVYGSSRSLDGASFVASSTVPIAVVTFNYRLNSLGFLPSELFERSGLLNLGLRDQRFLLQFLQTHLQSFGGDITQITLGGRSAGGHSTGIHYFHNYGDDQDKPLFSRAIFQSGSVTGRAFPPSDYPRYQTDFARYMKYLECSIEDGDEVSLKCLRGAPVDKIQYISSKMYAEAEATLSWPFQPTLGGPLLEIPGSLSGVQGSFHHLPAITSHVTDEGKFYTPGTLETNDDFLSYMYQMNLYLNFTDIALLNELYPDPVAHINSPYVRSTNSTQYDRLSAAWSDMAYICPSRESAFRISTAGVPVWRVRFNTPDNPLEYQAWRGIPHTSDAAYTHDSPDVAYPVTAHIYHGYLASFVALGDPNAARFPGTPEWPQYHGTPSYGLDRAEQLVIHPGTFTTVEKDVSRLAECDFWNDPDRAPRLNK